MQGLASHAPHQVRALMNTNTSGLKDFSFVQAMGSPFAPGKLTQDHFTRRHQPETVYPDLPKWARFSSGNSATDFKLFEPKSVSKTASSATPTEGLIASDAATPGISIFMALS
ncbi:MAG: hypothetical protein K2X66_16140, partial [Cyanobacteria bacterium]|nr:hypothetical protein [Cyanobacteriota bacterium]